MSGATSDGTGGGAPPRRNAVRRRLALAVFAAIVIVAFVLTTGRLSPSDAKRDATTAASTAAPAPTGPTTTAAPRPPGPPLLVLYDVSGEWASTGQIDAIFSANLLGHRGTVTRVRVSDYTPGLISQFAGAVYTGTTFDEPLPVAMLDDIATTTVPVVWAGLNIWQLDQRLPGGLEARFGFRTGLLDTRPMTRVTYRGVDLDRRATDDSNQVVPITISDPARARALGTIGGPDGADVVWGASSEHFTYVGESPYTFMSEGDRYLAWADVLLGAFAPDAPERHRALVRLEDIGPESDSVLLRSAIDELVERKIPFSMAVYPLFMDPRGTQGKRYGSKGTPALRLDQRPKVVAAIRYGLQHGGTIVSHGYTHQYGTSANPYDAVSGKDFEFYRAIVDPQTDDVDLTGPVRDDSTAWAAGRMTKARDLLAAAGLPLAKVTMFEFPHYAASTASYEAVNQVYGALGDGRPPTRYERGLYFPATATGEPDIAKAAGQFFPYAVTDVYGARVVPENLGNVIETGYNNNAPRTPADIVESARRNLVVRDGVASFFYHPYLGPKLLAETLDGIRALGYDFVAAEVVAAS